MGNVAATYSTHSLIMMNYANLTDAISDLTNRGFSLDFNIAFDHLKCLDNGVCLYPKQFEITEVYQFNAHNNQLHSNILYTIVSKDGFYKGVMVEPFGNFVEYMDAELMKKLHIHINSDEND